MNRIVKQILIGTVPLWVGVVLNAVLTIFPIPIFIFSAIFLILWGWLCSKACVRGEGSLQQAFFLSVFGIVMLALVLVQELILGSYWVSYFGLATQMYFMPGLSFFVVLLSPFMEILTPWPVYIAEMAGMFLTALLGCWVKNRKKK